jgi:hypothetical protein
MLLRFLQADFPGVHTYGHSFCAFYTAAPDSFTTGKGRFSAGTERDAAAGRRVMMWPLVKGRWRFMVEMSADGLEWAKKAACHVMFQTARWY